MLLYCGKVRLIHLARIFSIKGKPISAKISNTTSVRLFLALSNEIRQPEAIDSEFNKLSGGGFWGRGV
jgi:hypothetical protein